MNPLKGRDLQILIKKQDPVICYFRKHLKQRINELEQRSQGKKEEDDLAYRTDRVLIS